MEEEEQPKGIADGGVKLAAQALGCLIVALILAGGSPLSASPGALSVLGVLVMGIGLLLTFLAVVKFLFDMIKCIMGNTQPPSSFLLTPTIMVPQFYLIFVIFS